jgi:hypothetical protein
VYYRVGEVRAVGHAVVVRGVVVVQRAYSTAAALSCSAVVGWRRCEFPPIRSAGFLTENPHQRPELGPRFGPFVISARGAMAWRAVGGDVEGVGKEHVEVGLGEGGRETGEGQRAEYEGGAHRVPGRAPRGGVRISGKKMRGRCTARMHLPRGAANAAIFNAGRRTRTAACACQTSLPQRGLEAGGAVIPHCHSLPPIGMLCIKHAGRGF